MQTLKLQYRTWDEREVTIPLGPGKHRIGRTASNDVMIDELAVSEHHCMISIDSEGAQLIDADSLHGTFLDGALVQSSPLIPGQTINLGTLMVKVLGGDEERNPVGKKQLLESILLDDGSYSCLTHQDHRAGFECPSCYHLYCLKCVSDKSEHEICPNCGKEADAIDWSGLEMTPRDAAVELMPENLKKAWGFWQKWKARQGD